METQTLFILAALILGFVAMTLVLKKPASQDASIAALTSALNQAQHQMATLMEQRIGTADQSFTNQVASVQRQLEALATQTRELEQIRQGAVSTLTQMTGDTKQAVDRLNAETAILTGALSGTQTRGKWGEISLRRLVESVGMQEHVDFVEQKQEIGEGVGKPDLHILLPGDRVLYVDSKVPWDNYQQYVAATDEVVAKRHLDSHVAAVKAHINALAKRDYVGSAASLDYVIMYVPIEPALSAALMADDGLLSYAASKNVVLASPLSLIVILNNFHKSWDDDAKVRNIEAIVAATDELVKRMATMVGHMSKVGAAIGKAGEAFNDAAGSYNSRVVPAAAELDKLREKSLTLDEVQPVVFEPRTFRVAASESKPGRVEELRVGDIDFDGEEDDDSAQDSDS